MEIQKKIYSRRNGILWFKVFKQLNQNGSVEQSFSVPCKEKYIITKQF